VDKPAEIHRSYYTSNTYNAYYRTTVVDKLLAALAQAAASSRLTRHSPAAPRRPL